MYEGEKRVLARHYLDEGVSKAEVARRVGIGRRTLYNWIAGGLLEGRLGDQGSGYGPRRPRASKLDRFKGIIRARLAEHPELSAVRLFEEVRAAGYPGGYDQVKRHIREVRLREPVEWPVRFETPPGHQGQVDFAEFGLPWGRRHALMVVLGYSRRMWLRFYERQTMGVVMRGLEESFACFGGVPSEMLFDQMKAVVLSDGRNSGSRLVENAEFRGFSDHWGFRIRAAGRAEARASGGAASGADRCLHGSEGRGRAPSSGRLRARCRRIAVKAAPSRSQRIAAQLADLKMPGALESLDEVLAGVDGGGFTAAEAIERLLAAQIELRNSRRLATAMRSSRLPGLKTLADFDFSFQPSIKREQIDSLHEFGFLERKENVVFLGPPGVGKTHLAISLAVAAAESGRRIYFGTLADLIDSLEDAHAAGQLKQRLKTLTHPALLVVDEIGYLSVTPNGAKLFFQLVNARYGRASTVLTSNKSFEHWGEILHDEVMAAALLDRLLHRCHIVNIRGNSFRMRSHAELSKAIHPTASRAADAKRARQRGES